MKVFLLKRKSSAKLTETDPRASASSSLSSSASSCSRKVFVLLALTIQNTALVLITKFSYRKSARHYHIASVIVFAEVIKLALSYVLLVTSESHNVANEALRAVPANASRLGIPSMLYVVQNNLIFEGVRLLSPTCYMVCSQSKILTSALFSVLLLKSQISRKQYKALVLLMCGMVMVQYSEQNQTLHFQDARNAHIGETLRGMLVVFTAALTSGFTGAYLEKVYKTCDTIERSIWYRNLQLGCFSLLVALLAMIWRDRELLQMQGVFQGYNSIVLTIILLQAIGGLIVAAVLRYAGNVLKCFAVSISICNCTVATAFLSDKNQIVNITGIIGIAVVIGSTFMYSNLV